MEGSKVIQHLLRPADTCVIVVQGYLLMGINPPSGRLIAIVKHEGTEEHALFLFEKDMYTTPTIVKVEACYPIKGSFSTEVKAIVTDPSLCHVLVNNDMGSSIALQLPYDEHTAVFISQINKALHQLAQSRLVHAFSWLLGYENCRTGWDRFTKPISLLMDSHMNLNSDPYHIKDGFPESWPWSHIITPNSDGKTEIAKCELLENFDPLLQKDSSLTATPIHPHPSTMDDVPSNSEIQFSITDSSPNASSSLRKTSPFHSTDDYNPFLSSSGSNNSDSNLSNKGLKHGISDTNVHKLQQEALHPMCYMEPHMTRSEEDLTATTVESSPRHCVAKTTRDKIPNGSSKISKKHRNHDDGRFSNSLFFFKIDDDDWVTFDSDNTKRKGNSNENSPKSNRRATSKFGSKHKLEFLNPSGIKPVTSKVNMYSPELSGRHNRKGVLNKSRDRSKSAMPAMLEKSSQWVSRYRPGVAVPIPGETARESIMQSELRHREKEFCLPVQIRVFCGTWNVNGRFPPFSMDPLFMEYEVKGEKESLPPDIYAIGFQELDLSAQCLLGNESSRESMWVESVEHSLRHVGSYVKLQLIRLVGIMLVVYIKESLVPFVSDVEVDQVTTGMHGYMGNKGGVGVHFNLYHSSLCFVNVHFSAHMEEVDKRNQEFAHIMNKMIFNTPVTPYDVVHHDMIFWLGDLNYRITTSPEMSCDQVRAHADNYQFSSLFKLDQLLNEMKKNNVFVGFLEEMIDFRPSYKYDPNTDNWDTSEKHRAPAWCDRILYRGKDIVQCRYISHPTLNISDHKPVSAIFDTTLVEVDPEKEKSVLELITWRLDKLENDTLPQVDLNVTEFNFKDVRFKIPQSRRLVVTNTGQRPVHISIIPKLDDTSLTKDWLTVKPTSAVIHPLEDAVIEFTVLVDEDSAPPLTTGKAQLEDILVLHLEKGKDFFITVSGNYLPSCFGSSLDTLVNLHTYIREVPVAKLIDLTSSWEECVLEPKTNSTQAPPALDIPKELFAIVDFIERNGIDKDGLFSGGLQAESEEIRDMLDTGGKDLPGSVFSVASTLLTFLAALAEPVIPVFLHSRCMDACNNATLCKQILSQVPPVHRTTFIFLVDFMKNLLKHSDENYLDPKVLATVFGEVLLRTPLPERKSKSRRQLNAMNRKKATFLYQLIVNDLSAI